MDIPREKNSDPTPKANPRVDSISHMLAALLPYTASGAYLAHMSHGVGGYDVTDKSLQGRATRAAINTIAIAAICYAAIEVAERTDRFRGVLYGAALCVIAYILPRLLLRAVVETYCASCPANGTLSMGLVVLGALFVADQTLRDAMQQSSGD